MLDANKIGKMLKYRKSSFPKGVSTTFVAHCSLDIRTISFVYNYYLRKSLSKTFRAMMNIVVALPPSCAKEFRDQK